MHRASLEVICGPMFAGKTTELMTSLFRDAFKPYSARMTAAVESVQSAR